MKPFSESCVQNAQPIFNVIKPLFTSISAVLEIGSGTGQHAIYFAKKMPHLVWYTSDVEDNHAGIQQWLSEVQLDNVRPPISLNTRLNQWPNIEVDAVFSANTVHIMHWLDVVALFKGVGKLLKKEGLFTLYGPFNYRGHYTSSSNESFDQWLKNRDKNSGIKDFEALNELAREAGLTLMKDYIMPENNRLLYWKK